MFIHCKRNLHIQEGSESLNLKNGFVGEIDDRWAKHWYINAAISDRTIVTTDTTEKPAKKGKKSAEPEEPSEDSTNITDTTEKPAE
ncbi:hypothetical protein [Oscillibacter sp.]|uniref:hypothetical protein n=1 Tax=Oscillibacter sp. TaxID=1945593 RepID=UPI00289C9C54|nr:hypothetical protein [Oscillibacter sp.]